MLVHPRSLPCNLPNNLPVPIYTPGWREALQDTCTPVSILPKNTTQCPRPGLEPGPLTLGILTRRSPWVLSSPRKKNNDYCKAPAWYPKSRAHCTKHYATVTPALIIRHDSIKTLIYSGKRLVLSSTKFVYTFSVF